MFGRRRWSWVATGVGIALGLSAAAVLRWQTIEPIAIEASGIVLHRSSSPEFLIPKAPAPVPAPTIEPKDTPAPEPLSERDVAKQKLQEMGMEANATSLVRAAETGDASSIDLLIKAGVPPNGTDETGEPALLVAVKK